MQHPQCPTSKHPETPRWYTTDWSKFVKTVGEHNANAQRNSFYAGFTDVYGVHWCGHCFFQQQLIDIGAQIGYPNAHDLYSIEQTRDMVGYDAWMQLARSGGPVLVQVILRAAEKVLMALYAVIWHLLKIADPKSLKGTESPSSLSLASVS